MHDPRGERIGWRAWTLAAVVAALVHLPLLWVTWIAPSDDAPTQQVVRLNLELAPVEPIEVPTPDSLKIRWALGAEPDPETPIPEFPTLMSGGGLSGGLDGALGSQRIMSSNTLNPNAEALDAQLVLNDSPSASPAQDAESREIDDPSAEQPAEAERAGAAEPEAKPQRVDVAVQPPPQPSRAEAPADVDVADQGVVRPVEPVIQAAETDQADSARTRPDPIEALVNEALTRTSAIRTPRAVEPVELPRRPPAAEPAEGTREPQRQAQQPRVAATSQPPAPRNVLPERPVQASQSVQPVQPTRPAQSTARPVAPTNDVAGPDPRYDPAGPAGPVSVSGNVFFSQLASQLFAANDAVVRSAPLDAQKQVVDVRFAVDRGGRVMRVWLPRSLGSESLDQQAIALIWRAAPFPQLAPDMPQQALELTFPVVVIQ